MPAIPNPELGGEKQRMGNGGFVRYWGGNCMGVHVEDTPCSKHPGPVSACRVPISTAQDASDDGLTEGPSFPSGSSEVMGCSGNPQAKQRSLGGTTRGLREEGRTGGA